MAEWYADLQPGDDWSHVDVVQVLFKALQERQYALKSQYVTRFPTTGADVQSARDTSSEDYVSYPNQNVGGDSGEFSLYYVQQWIDNHANNFVQDVDASNGPVPHTLASLLADSGGDWLRNNDGENFTTGRIQPGDIIGPWIFNQIKEALRRMHKVALPATLADRGYFGSWYLYVQDDWEAALNRLNTDYTVWQAQSAPSPSPYYNPDGSNVAVWFLGGVDDYGEGGAYGPGTNSRYNPYAMAVPAGIMFTSNAWAWGTRVEVWVRPNTSGSPYDDFGTGLTVDQWQKISTVNTGDLYFSNSGYGYRPWVNGPPFPVETGSPAYYYEFIITSDHIWLIADAALPDANGYTGYLYP